MRIGTVRQNFCCHVGGMLLVWLSFTLGCSKGGIATFPVEGRVTFEDGRPFARGVVEARPKSGSPRVTARGATDDDGNFRLQTFQPEDGAVAGTHQVIVLPIRGPGDERPETSRGALNPVHSRYETSQHEFVVDGGGGENYWKIVLTR